MSVSPASIIQKVVSNRGAASYGEREASAPGAPAIYFELEISDPSQQNLNPLDLVLAEERGERQTLQPGGKYLVKVIAGQYNKDGLSPVYPNDDISLYWSCPQASEIKVSPAVSKVVADDIATLDQDYELTIPMEALTGDYELKLWVAQGKGRPRPVSTQSFRIEGKNYPVDRELLTTCRIALDVQLPEHTAILHIEAADESGKYRLMGWSSREKPLQAGPIEQPMMALANFVEEQLDPETIKNNLSSFSRRNSVALMKWLDALHQRHGEQLCMIIADHSVSELPWEMMEIHQGKYLGAVCKVVRWIPVQFYTIWEELCVREEEERAGKVLAYLNDVELDTHLEREALRKLTASYCENTAILKQNLSQPLNAVAMVYLGCHGMFTYNEKHRIAVGELNNPGRQLVSLSIEAIERHEGARPLLFVNACHSARLMKDSNGFFGLPEVSLARIASAYLGTLGPVGTSYAAKIANYIFTEAIKRSIEPAEILRELRADAVKKLAQSEMKDNWFNFLYTFMYVYYGNPFIKIRLGHVAEPEGDA